MNRKIKTTKMIKEAVICTNIVKFSIKCKVLYFPYALPNPGKPSRRAAEIAKSTHGAASPLFMIQFFREHYPL